MSLGAEATLKIPLRERIKTGRADTLYGNVIIEFERDLAKTGDHAVDQLREYVSADWKPNQSYSYTLIATDCLEWRIYAVDFEAMSVCLVDADCTAEDLTLKETDRFTLGERTLDAFYYFLDRYLFQTEVRKPTLDAIKRDFGETSSVFLTSFRLLAQHFRAVRQDPHVQTAFEQWQRFLSIAYGSFEAREDVFLVHTYLSLFAKVLAYEVLTGDTFINEDEQRRIVDGSEFEKRNVRNFATDDFYNWIADARHRDALKPVFRTITQAIGRYDFSSVDEDILKGVYQELIDLETRHALGEY